MSGASDLLQVARMYYLYDMTQEEIAADLRVSRSTVSRWLSRCRSEGLVRIHLQYPYSTNAQLAAEVEKRYGIKEALVVQNPSYDEETCLLLLGRCAAFYLRTVVVPGCTLGLSWGRTLREMVNAMEFQGPLGVKVVQLSGGLPEAPHQLQANSLVQRVAGLLSGEAVYLHAPALVANRELASSLRAESNISEALETGRRAQVAFVGVGACGTHGSLTHSGLFTPDEMEELAQCGAVGEMGGRFFRADGSPLPNPYDERSISISLEDMRNIGNLVGVAGGPGKVDAIAGALRGGYLDTLVTDEATAQSLVHREEPDNPKG